MIFAPEEITEFPLKFQAALLNDSPGCFIFRPAINFDPVKTKALRLEVVLPVDNSAGLFEWIIK